MNTNTAPINYIEWVDNSPCEPNLAAILIMGKNPLDSNLFTIHQDPETGYPTTTEINDKEIAKLAEGLTWDFQVEHGKTDEPIEPIFYFVERSIKLRKYVTCAGLLEEINNYYKHCVEDDKRKFESKYPYLTRELKLSASPTKNENSNQKLVNNLLKIVLGMAIDKYGYDPLSIKPQAATGTNKDSIKSRLEDIGLKISNDTIRQRLQEAYDTHQSDLKTDKTQFK